MEKEKKQEIIEKYKPDVVIDVVLHACHSYNVESFKVKRHVEGKHKIPVMKIETDSSQSDVGGLRTRIEALLETVPKKVNANC